MFTASLLVVSILLYLSFASAYSFSITNSPQQCQNLSISITGLGGVPPYTATIIPSGPDIDRDNRKTISYPFEHGDSTINFLLNYPTDSQFVIVVSINDFTIFSWVRTDVP